MAKTDNSKKRGAQHRGKSTAAAAFRGPISNDGKAKEKTWRAGYRARCIIVRSSQRPNFVPTSRAVPTTSKPRLAWRVIDGVLAASMLAIITCAPDAVAASIRV